MKLLEVNPTLFVLVQDNYMRGVELIHEGEIVTGGTLEVISEAEFNGWIQLTLDQIKTAMSLTVRNENRKLKGHQIYCKLQLKGDNNG